MLLFKKVISVLQSLTLTLRIHRHIYKLCQPVSLSLVALSSTLVRAEVLFFVAETKNQRPSDTASSFSDVKS